MRTVLDMAAVEPLRAPDGTVIIRVQVLAQIPAAGAPPMVVQTIDIPFDPLSAHKFVRDLAAVVNRTPVEEAEPELPGNRAERRRAEREQKKNGGVILA